jgi:hypothetical protein
MRWPDLVVRAQMKRVARDVALDIRKKVFVGRDAESRRPALPFDFECSANVDLGKGANRSVIRFHVTIASNANPPASRDQADAHGQKYNRNLLHGKYDSVLTMQARLALDSRKFPDVTVVTSSEVRELISTLEILSRHRGRLQVRDSSLHDL